MEALRQRAAGAWAAVRAGRTDARTALAGGDAAEAALAALEGAVLRLGSRGARLVVGAETLETLGALFGCASESGAVLEALCTADPTLAAKFHALTHAGEPFAAQARLDQASIDIEGRSMGALAWVRLSIRRQGVGSPEPGLLTEFLDARAEPVWLAKASGEPAWANAAWLKAVEAKDLAEALARGLSLDAGADALAREAAAAGQARGALRWITLAGRRRAFQIEARPLPGGLTAVSAVEVTDAEQAREALRRHVQAQGETLDHIGEAVAIFSSGRVLLFHNIAFAALWGLEPAWLAEGPTHGEILDRLRQRRRLPETGDYAAWKAAQLHPYEDLGAAADEIWPLPDGRTLRLVRQLHPLGGLLMLYSDITDELKLKAQYNSLIQVQRATLDKLSDAVAVFGSDGRLRLHNDAFSSLWGATAVQLEEALDFDGVVELCLRRVSDLAFWRELKARVTDTDPEARAAQAGEVRASDGRIIAYRSRPLPDGATLLAFSDVTDTRKLQSALAELQTALSQTERLKRDFVGNVSYELRTPLTTILGYAELLEGMAEGLGERARGHVGAVRAAAGQLARSIDDVLDIAQADAGDMTLDLAETPIGPLLAQAAERWRAAASGAGVLIQVSCPDDVGAIRADRRRLGQVLDHLLENAIGQSPPGGVVSLTARRGAGEVRIVVADAGRGIPFHVQAHLFDRFVPRERGGPGLGLALVKAIVELHGGWVALESAPGAGAAFTCHLPDEALAPPAGA
jgi:signal transduction histidine kinase